MAPFIDHVAVRAIAFLTDGDVYVYFASWAYLGQAATERFHWGRIAINP